LNLEAKKDATHSFSFPNDVFGSERRLKNLPVAITTATISIDKGDGTAILAAAAMTISGDTYSASYSWDSTGQVVAENYRVTFTINGAVYVRFMDIYNYVFGHTVCDDDLFAIDRELRDKTWRVAGKATDGTTSTLVDTNRIEDDAKFNGGMIELFYDAGIQRRNITSFTKTTKTILFTPVVDVAVSEGLGYAARESFQSEIDTASDEVQERFTQIEKRAYLLIDYSQTKKPIIYKVLANYWRQKVKEKDDEYDLRYRHYLEEYENYFANTIWKYDEDKDALIDDEETAMRSRVRWFR
jgi:hypothetical protein